MTVDPPLPLIFFRASSKRNPALQAGTRYGYDVLPKASGASMRRREFIGFVGGAVSAWPFGALAQQRDHLRRIGVLMGFAETDEVWQTYLRVFRERLRDFGWTEGQNIKSNIGLPAKVSNGHGRPPSNWSAANRIYFSSRQIQHCLRC